MIWEKLTAVAVSNQLMLLMLLLLLLMERGLCLWRRCGRNDIIVFNVGNFLLLRWRQIKKLTLLRLKALLSFVFCLFLVGQPTLGDLVFGTGLVSIVETVPEGRRDLFSCHGFARYRVGVSVVTNKGRRRAFLEAHFLYRKVNIRDDGRLDHLGLGVDVLLDLAVDERSEFAIARGLLGNSSFSNHDSARRRLDCVITIAIACIRVHRGVIVVVANIIVYVQRMRMRMRMLL